jgi:hypothetical protein
MTARRWRTDGGASVSSGHGTGAIEEVLHRSVGVLLLGREGGGGGREPRAAVVIGAFMAAITGSEGGVIVAD